MAVAIASTAQPAAAQPDGLTWSAERCGSVAALRARIAVHLGRPLEERDAIQAAVDVVRAPIDGDVRATVQIETRRGRAAREVHGANCAAVVDAVAFVLASAVTDDGEVPARPGAATVAADAVVPWIIRPVAVPPRRPAPRLGVQLGLDGWTDAGTLSQLRYGLGASLAIDWSRARAEVSAATWEDDWSPLNGPSSGDGVRLRSVTARGCYGVSRLWLCGGVLQGKIREGRELPSAWWLAVGFQTLWSRPIAGPVRIAASIEGLVNLVRPALSDGGGRAPIAVRLGLGLAVVLR